jgi:hypothetical protein
MPTPKRRNNSHIRSIIGEKLIQLIKKTWNKPHKRPWDWHLICINKNITIDILEKYPDMPWDWQWVSANRNITEDYIESHLDKNWNWEWISRNINISLEFIESHIHKDWNWEWISANNNLTIEFINRHKNKRWNWYLVSSNSNITPDIIESHPDIPWNWNAILLNPNITLEFIKRHLDKDLQLNNLLYNKYISLDIIDHFSDNFSYFTWFDSFSKNINITEKDVEKYKDKDLNWVCILSNPDIASLEFIQKYIHKYNHISWTILSKNTNITEEFVYKNIDKGWDWFLLSQNLNISANFIKKYKHDMEYRGEIISHYSNLTFDFIDSHPDLNWDYYAISTHEFNYEYDQIQYKLDISAHNQKMALLCEEFKSIIYHPDNIEKFLIDNQLLDNESIQFWKI